MLDKLKEEAVNEIKFGYLKKKYPTRNAYLSTIRDQFPISRTVILRDVIDEINPVFFTDSRSTKLDDILKNPNASVLFYNSKNLKQIRLEGQIKMITDHKLVEKYRQKALSISKKDYSTSSQPGSIIKNPDEVNYVDNDFFQGIYLEVSKIEFLKLKRPHHLRCLFKKEDENWTHVFLTP